MGLERFENCHDPLVQLALAGLLLILWQGRDLPRNNAGGNLEHPCTAGILSSVARSELGVGISYLEDSGELVHLAFLLELLLGFL